MTSRDALRSDRTQLINKAKGALCGLAIGDSFGDAARKPDYQRDYGITTDFHPGDSWSTDDTEFALLVAETIIQAGGEFTAQDVEDMWMRHVVCQDSYNRGGASEIEAAQNLRDGLHAPQSGMFGTHTHSDGAAMRAGPIGILCAGDPERAARLARVDAEISHAADGIWAAQMVAASVAMAMVDTPFDQIFQHVLTLTPADSWLRYSMNLAYSIVDEAGGDVANAWMPLHYRLFKSYRATSAEAISQAYGCLRLMHGSFKEGLLLAANFGRDADTIGAVVGCILGARYGADVIPAYWIEHTRYPSGTCLAFTKGIDVVERAERLADLVERNA